MTDLAPVMVSTYSRLEHLKKTIAALQKNTLAKSTELYVFSDAPKPGDEEVVCRVREYLKTISGFRAVHVVERSTNGRVENNRGGLEQLLRQHGKAIFLEDDIVTAPGFLQYINDGLNCYEHQKDVLAVGGYTPTLNIADRESDAIALPRFITWGYGIWADRYQQIAAISREEYLNIANDQVQLQRLASEYGNDLIDAFKAESNGHLNGLDMRGCYLQFTNNMISVYPKRSLVQNIGHDGSGLHSGLTCRYDVEPWEKTSGFQLPENINSDSDINKQCANWFSLDQKHVSSEVINNIVEQVRKSGVTSFSIWGLGVVAECFVRAIQGEAWKVNHVIDSWPEPGQAFLGKKVLTPSEAIATGENNIVVLSFASRYKMRDAARDIAPDINIYMYQAT